ncbi:MAG: nuclear transport factor 2 family protein [Alphaproteobacteria bacterium]|nr:nuclear transport factor 2 family protein [Alphaproteobacteria bacterium]MBU1515015.1 nuclear transport factor 2 family protein [Alphaproteobacteria bacterium]MBU2095664.1 nuclear transport factor 2 family protein [Alphaproteobacteria bacterium]MBU2151032.1 nuclear transport factor 2 family protein [Alphaproteobacteria bacterium]MBU2306895.1 nuclear transport factor 2 family protein [Alphaproteobacteria bacterium]
MKSSSLALAALLLASPALAAPIDPAPVVAAERAFAADGLELGVQASFLKHSAPEGILFAPEPVLAKAVFGTPRPKGTALVWWPLWAGIARSGDLGFTTGPYTADGKPGGYYFTVWSKQPDGSWKWLFDGGPPSDTTGAAPQGSDVAYAKPAARQTGSPSKALDQVMKAEVALHAAARTDVKAAFLAAVADDGRIVGSNARPPATRAELEAELATRPTSVAFSALGGQASSAGDLAWTYGVASWTRDGAQQRGHYVRIWRNDQPGWRLLFDELLPAPALKSPPVKAVAPPAS